MVTPVAETRSPWVALRQRALGHSMDLGIRALSRAGRLLPAARDYLEPVVTHANIPYLGTGARAHVLDVVRPRAHVGEPLPVVLYLHGGGFRILSKDTHWMMAGAFGARGYLVFNANYRLSGEAPYPAAVEDAAAALLWVLDHAHEHGGDSARVVLAGESAGANLVTALTVACCFARAQCGTEALVARGFVPTAVAALCGLLEVSRWSRFEAIPMPGYARDRIDQVCRGYLGDRADDSGAHLDLANPLTVLERDEQPVRALPPFAASVGTADPVLDDTRRLERALARRGIRHHVSYHPSEPHAFQAMIWRDEARRSWRELFAFLDAVVPAQSQPTRVVESTISSR